MARAPRARGPRTVGGWRSRLAPTSNLTRRWFPLLAVAVLSFVWAVPLTAGWPAGLFLAVGMCATGIYVSWQSRRRAMTKAGVMSDRLTIWVHLCDLVRVWMLWVWWPTAVRNARFTRADDGTPVIIPMPRPSRRPDCWWYFDIVTGVIVTHRNVARHGVLYEDVFARTGALSQFVGAYDTTVKHLRSAKPIATGRFAGLRNAIRPMSGVVEMRFFYNDPVGTNMRLAELPVAPVDRIAIGRHSDRSPATLRYDLSTLIYGGTGMGKSNALRVILADLIRKDIPVELHVIDPKNQEMRRFKRQIGVGTNPNFKVVSYAVEPADITRVINDVAKQMKARQAVLGDTDTDTHKPTTAMPLVLVAVDEFLSLTDEVKKAVVGPLTKIAYTGRASGFAFIGLAQDPTKEALGQIRDLVPQKVAFKLNSASSAVPALGVPAPVNLLSGPGVALLMRDGDNVPSMIRVPEVVADEADMIAAGRVPDMPGDEVTNTITEVYRYWGHLPADRYPQFADEDGNPLLQLLYVGQTNDFKRRHKQHVDEEEWTDWVDDALTTRQPWPSLSQALAEEERAIKAERPLFNELHNKKNPFRQKNPRRTGSQTRWHRRVAA
jgi:predicted GIY-YIG superfamily endonuclease